MQSGSRLQAPWRHRDGHVLCTDCLVIPVVEPVVGVVMLAAAGKPAD